MATKAKLKLETVGDILDAMPAGMGHNLPPEPTAYEATLAAVTALDDEAKATLTGGAVVNQDQADAVSALVQEARAKEAKIKAAHKDDKAPHLAAGRAVDAQYAPLTATCERVKAAALAALGPWLKRLDDEQREREAEAARRAAEAVAAAAAAQAKVDATDLASVDEAEAIVKRAAQALKEQRQAETARALATGGMGKAIGLRTIWSAKITDARAALNHYARERRDDLTAWVQAQADRDAKGDRGSVPGIEFVSEQVAR